MAFSLDFIRPGEGTATRNTLEDGSYLIGRGNACRIRLPFPDVSERHALLLLLGDKAKIEDLHSANGTYVNGMPTDGIVELLPDSVIQIGESMLRVSPISDDQAPVPDPRSPRTQAGSAPR